MVEIVRGDLFEAEVEALVNAVNCDGVMGKGIALRLKQSFPENFSAYSAACKQNRVQPGRMFIFSRSAQLNPRFIVNFPTKLHWRGKSRMEYIESGLTDLVEVIQDKGIRSIAIPALGCGNGGLVWKDVLLRVQHTFDRIPDVKALVYPSKV